MDHIDRPCARRSGSELVRAPFLDRTGLQDAQERRLAMAEDPEDQPGADFPALARAIGNYPADPGLWDQGGRRPFDRKIAPGSLRAPPKWLASTHRSSRSRPGRTVSLVRHGIGWLRRLMHRGRLWSRVWLLPEPWPEPKPGLEIHCLAPA